MKRLLLSAFLLSALPAYSALLLTLSPPAQTRQPGATITFNGTLENTGLADLFLNDLVFAYAPPAGTYLTADLNVFFANVPGVLLPGETYNGPIFSLIVAAGTPLGTYTGAATVQGGADPFALDALATGPFTVTVVPEPATFGLIAGALAALAVRRATVRTVPTVPTVSSVPC